MSNSLRISFSRLAHRETNFVVITQSIQNTLLSLSDSNIGEPDISLALHRGPTPWQTTGSQAGIGDSPEVSSRISCNTVRKK